MSQSFLSMHAMTCLCQPFRFPFPFPFPLPLAENRRGGTLPFAPEIALSAIFRASAHGTPWAHACAAALCTILTLALFV